MKRREPGVINDAVVREIAEEADTDERSVVRRIAGLPVRGRAGKRIDRILASRLGDEAPVTSERGEP